MPLALIITSCLLCFNDIIVLHRATTHTDLVVRAKKLGVDVKVVHNASVMNAIGVCGLQLYRYGETVSIPFFTDAWRPDSFYEKIQRNRKLGLHTLCLLGKINIFCLSLGSMLSHTISHVSGLIFQYSELTLLTPDKPLYHSLHSLLMILSTFWLDR